MRRLSGLTVIFLGLAVFALSGAAAETWQERLQQRLQGSNQTTPARAFLKRQCESVKRGVSNVPGIKDLMWRREFRQTHPQQAPPIRLLPF
jgi:hypothetical protein